MEQQFEILSDSVELSDQEGTVTLSERHFFNDEKEKVIQYITEDQEGNKRFWKATKDPEKLSDKERHEILTYCLSSFDEDEIVNYHDLFLHGKFVEETSSDFVFFN